MTHGHGQQWGELLDGMGMLGREGKRGKIRITVIAKSIKYNLKNKINKNQ